MEAQNIAAMLAITAIVLFGLWRWFSVREARLTGRHEEEYQKLAADATAAQQSANAQLAELTGMVTELRTRIAAIEKILREVP